MTVFLNYAKQVARAGRSHIFHRRHNNAAADALQALEKVKGKLRPEVAARCLEYAVDVLGHKKYAPWLYVYAAVSGEFKEGWIPDNFYGECVVPAVQGNYGRVSGLRAISGIIFSGPELTDVAHFVNGMFTDDEFRILSREDIKDHIFRTHDRVVFKLDRSLSGLGIYFFDKDNFDVNKISALGDGTFQYFIQQHEFFNQFAAGSLATIRLTTVTTDDGAVSLRGGFLRLGLGGDSHVRGTNSVEIPLDLQSGEFFPEGTVPTWEIVRHHPDTGAAFEGKVVPGFANCIDTVKRLHGSFPFVRCIGWDIAVTDAEEVKLIEWNAGHNDIGVSEAWQGPCFKDLNWQKYRKHQPTRKLR
jgi:hypothetical protein